MATQPQVRPRPPSGDATALHPTGTRRAWRACATAVALLLESGADPDQIDRSTREVRRTRANGGATSPHPHPTPHTPHTPEPDHGRED